MRDEAFAPIVFLVTSALLALAIATKVAGTFAGIAAALPQVQ